ncbi:MAG TPA: sigma-70 family RNA polymerase sigma factor [Bacillales bacterium]|nr:sigma-70 family RNA polymerase sigma factor [Bacillales bacterium]
MKPTDDLQMLMAEIKGGSMEAFEAFYEQMAPFVFSVAMKVMKDRREAEDVCHDVFFEVYRKASGYDPSRGSVNAWLAVKTKSRCLDRLRKQQRVVVEEPREGWQTLFADPGFSTEEKVMKKVDGEAVYSALTQIPESQQQAIFEKFYGSRTQKEIAAHMKRPVGTVKSLIRYGIHNMRKQLQQFGWPESAVERRREP